MAGQALDDGRRPESKPVAPELAAEHHDGEQPNGRVNQRFAQAETMARVCFLMLGGDSFGEPGALLGR
jgi:hypothetical protein